MNIKEMKALYKKASESYFNGDKSLMSDKDFDSLEKEIRNIDPKWSGLRKLVAPKKFKVALNHPMPSLTKFYGEDIATFLNGRKVVAMPKLDGSSLQIVYKNGKPVAVVTRGDGNIGGDITHLMHHLNLPKVSGNAVLRCEALMSKKNFKKWENEFDNARNMVNGLLNRKESHPAMNDIDIITLGQYGEKISTTWLMVNGIKLPEATTLAQLENLLADTKKKFKYEVDGLVLADKDWVMHYENADKPKSIVAFKVNDASSAVECTVEKIVWQITGRQRIVPKVQITLTKIDGVMIQFVTAHNAQWAMEHKLGKGAKIKVLRSGGVIPKIIEVTKAAKNFDEPEIDYKVDGVHFVVKNKSTVTSDKINALVLEKSLTVLGIDFVAGKTAKKIVEGGTSNLAEIIECYGNGLLKTRLMIAVGGKNAERIFESIDKVFSKPVPILKLMVASQIFGAGIGERKLRKVQESGIKLCEMNKYDLSNVDGWQDKSASIITKSWNDWQIFEKEAGKSIRLIDKSESKKSVAGVLNGQVVTFTGYRDKEQEKWIVENGGAVAEFSSKTTALLFGGKPSSKIEKAKARGIWVGSFDEFKKHTKWYFAI